ncbi:tyrosine-type recombinase/integrase [Anabaena cylindrica FACHB-243]|uniref:Integrase family protein n=1 Tax=Anabaena cylindrica (strain ATCC 27899 / PCC 7122) TaxID=272123 RepID=K9ZSH2_ANACC|nr:MULTISPECIES: tyrosine-type recombinase/integrase [Anabaena]AFZ61315.1 integrase family protein [Anabaena cylindrica PCC 7122]MBD2420176.1 tyrosine-type recombinase/integrase [Anabaena cylindrica FACHB-243]MBY5282197.1 tyrosine-type recombinase/integrase [Anabaena sp. CCAP 1446/1C]MBY5309446.1 tyrosine-type recombinase/integrase [Anabaena sp. CCAP 1446/1C]MCM2409257.1 tyrosine-type recombinase/integrase [Anabaena sp. CCAP 1446/1C]
MKIDGCGQAKILSGQERELLLNKGFLSQRDRTLNELCFYTACRSCEARQILYSDIFNGDKIRETLILRKEITKGKQATRVIPVNPKLALSLEKYIQESQELLKIKQLVGQWDYKSLTCNDVFDENNQIICPKCSHNVISTAGKSRGKQLYKCKKCAYRFLVKTAFVESPELKDRVLQLGVYNSQSYGFLFANSSNPYLFPGDQGNGSISRTTVKEIFANACKRVGIIGAGTHSWRRTALTEMHKKKIPMKVIQNISGHVRLSNLQKYLEVSREEVEAAINSLP